MSKETSESEAVMHEFHMETLFTDFGHETIRELLLSAEVSGVLIEKRGTRYHIESQTQHECSRIMRTYIAAFPGSLSQKLTRRSDDLRQIKEWLCDGYTLLLLDRGDFVRVYRYIPV